MLVDLDEKRFSWVLGTAVVTIQLTYRAAASRVVANVVLGGTSPNKTS